MEPGETKKFREDSPLRAGIYTVEQLAAPDGYQLQLGERVQPVGLDGNTDKEGHFHINGTPGRLTLTAGGAQGDGMTHYYTLERTEPEEGDTSEFEKRIISLSSGEDYVLDNLPKGGYTVKEYTIDAIEQFTVKTSQTADIVIQVKSSALSQTGKKIWESFPITEGTDYIKMVNFGPLYKTSSSKKLNSTYTYSSFSFKYLGKNEKKSEDNFHGHSFTKISSNCF